MLRAKEEKMMELLKLPIAPRATDYAGHLSKVEDKIMSVPDELCWRCYLNINSHCTAFLHVGSDGDQEYRKDKPSLCHEVRNAT